MTNDEKAYYLLKKYKPMMEEMKTLEKDSEAYKTSLQQKKMVEDAFVSMKKKKYMYNVGKIDGVHEDVVKEIYCDVFYLAYIYSKVKKSNQIIKAIKNKHNIELSSAKVSKIKKNVAHICGKYFFDFSLTNFPD